MQMNMNIPNKKEFPMSKIFPKAVVRFILDFAASATIVSYGFA
jgi:hypothetical protein